MVVSLMSQRVFPSFLLFNDTNKGKYLSLRYKALN